MYVEFFRVRKIFRTELFAGFEVILCVDIITISKMRNLRCRLLFY